MPLFINNGIPYIHLRSISVVYNLTLHVYILSNTPCTYLY